MDYGSFIGSDISNAIGGFGLSETKTPKPKPAFDEKKIQRLMQVSKGLDPDAQQIVNDFIRMDNDIERTNLPTTNTVLCLAQLDFVSNWLFPEDKTNPFAQLSKSLSIAYMARKGEKSNQLVEILRNTPNLQDLKESVDVQRSLFERVTGRGKTE